MERHSCKTYFAVHFNIDREKNAALIREGRECKPQDIGIFNCGEVEKFIVEKLGVTPIWARHTFIIGLNDKYDVDVNVMLRKTLHNLFGKEELIKLMQKKFSVETVLQIVPYIATESDKPNQYLSPESDVIGFLYKSDTAIDIDYYII